MAAFRILREWWPDWVARGALGAQEPAGRAQDFGAAVSAVLSRAGRAVGLSHSAECRNFWFARPARGELDQRLARRQPLSARTAGLGGLQDRRGALRPAGPTGRRRQTHVSQPDQVRDGC